MVRSFTSPAQFVLLESAGIEPSQQILCRCALREGLRTMHRCVRRGCCKDKTRSPQLSSWGCSSSEPMPTRRAVTKCVSIMSKYPETINKRMRVPSRLKVADDSGSRHPKRTSPEDFPPSFQMYVPDRLLPAETREVAHSPFLVNKMRQHGLAVADPLPEPSVPPIIYEEHPFLSLLSRPGSQKRKRRAQQGRARKERILSETSQLALCGESQRCEWLDTGVPTAPALQFPPFPSEGKIYSLQNIFQALRFLGPQLLQLFRKPPHHAPLSAPKTSVILESPLEELGATEVLAMRKQLAKIARRLRSLEEQYTGWRQKELVVYSVLLSTGLLNWWLWLRR